MKISTRIFIAYFIGGLQAIILTEANLINTGSLYADVLLKVLINVPGPVLMVTLMHPVIWFWKSRGNRYALYTLEREFSNKSRIVNNQYETEAGKRGCHRED